MMRRVVRVLFLEDSVPDAKMVKTLIREIGEYRVELVWVETLAQAIQAIRETSFDLILTDLHVPDSDGLDTFEGLRAAAPLTPVVVLTGAGDNERMGEEAIRKGAQDYLGKDGLTSQSLRRSLLYAFGRHELESLKMDFLFMVNHDMNGPLNAALHAVTFMANDMPPAANPQFCGYVDMARRNLNHLKRLVNDLVDITKISAGCFAIRLKHTDIIPLIDSVCQAMAWNARRQRIEIVFEKNGNAAIPLQVDPERIEQVMFNLLQNAIRHAASNVRVRIKEMDTAVGFSVENDGPDLDPDEIPMLFDKHYQGKTERRGTMGMGLALVKNIVEAHGGTVRAENRPGGGPIFSATIPKVPAEPALAPQHR